MSSSIYISEEGAKAMMKAMEENSDGKDYLWTANKDVELPIYINKIPGDNFSIQTLPQILINTVKRSPNAMMLQEYDEKQKKWVGFTYAQALEEIKKIARAISALLIPPRSCVTIIGSNSARWVLSFWGAVFADCLPAGIYLTNSPSACKEIVDDCDAQLAFVEDKMQLEKFLIFSKESALKKIITFEKVDSKGDDQVMHYDSFLKLHVGSEENEVEQRRLLQKPGKPAILIYTSGTTGKGKGVLLSHDCFSVFYQTFHNMRINAPEQGRTLSYLPLSHIAGLEMDLIVPLMDNGCLYFADKDAMKGTLPWFLEQVRPTNFLAVPRVWEKFEDKIKSQVESGNFLSKKIFEWALKVGKEEARDILAGKAPSTFYKIANKLVFEKLKKKLGLHQALNLFTGAAPIKISTRDFFLSIGIPINNLYGLSESTGGFFGLKPDELPSMKLASCGKPYPGLGVVIGDQNEILLEGRTLFHGYLNKEAESKNSFDQFRRLKTGDVGKLDEKGHLFITGRIKEIIVTAGGENVAPIPMEHFLMEKLKPFTSAVVLIGDQQPYISALFFFKNKHDFTHYPSEELDQEAAEGLANQGVFVSKFEQLFEKNNYIELEKIISKAIDAVNKTAVSNAAKIKKWAVLPRDLSLATGEYTPTMKLRRKEVEKNFAQQISKLYSEPKL